VLRRPGWEGDPTVIVLPHRLARRVQAIRHWWRYCRRTSIRRWTGRSTLTTPHVGVGHARKERKWGIDHLERGAGGTVLCAPALCARATPTVLRARSTSLPPAISRQSRLYPRLVGGRGA